MKIELAVTIVNSEEAFNKSLNIPNFNNLLEKFQYENEYIDILKINILMVYTEGEYESFKDWYKLKKPKYQQESRVLVIETFLKNDALKIFENANRNLESEILSNLVLKTISETIFPAKLKLFDKERFKTDVEEFFKEEGII